MKFSRIALVILVFAAASSFAQITRTWDQTKYEEFEKGTAKGVAIRSDGTLELAPELTTLVTTPSTYIWSAASDADGNLFAAAGAPSRVYRITPEGKISVVLAPEELQVQAVIVAPDGAIYAATSPDGKIYRIVRRTPGAKPAAPEKSNGERANVTLDPNYTASVFFDPHTKYIWALALDKEGRLYVATGDHGEIFRVEKNGTGSVFFKSDEAHIRAIAFDANGNLIAGTDGSGLIYRISPTGQGFILYSAPKKEITAIAIDAHGNIYAAGAGDKRAAPAPVIAVPVIAPPVSAVPHSAPVIVPSAPSPALPQMPIPGLGATGSEVYRISPDGSPRRVWSSRADLVYALCFDYNGQLLAGTGNKGKIFAIYPNGEFTDLLQASASQVIGFARAPGGALYAVSSNLGKAFLLRTSGPREGSYESDVFDAKILSRWGRAEARWRGSVDMYARSGNVDNPDRNWSDWHKVDLLKDAELDTPPARFVQWKVVLHSGTTSPEVEDVRLNYLPRNVAPEVDDVIVMVGSRFQIAPRLTTDVGYESMPAPAAQVARPEIIPAVLQDSDYIAVRWVAHDPNDDQLTYSIYYRGDNETRWKLLKDGLADRFYSFDSSLLPDGGYTIKVVASDAPSHSPGDALTGSWNSLHFNVDNTPPEIHNLLARVENGKLHITFTANDGFSILKRAEFSIDAGDWQFIAPVGGLSDSKTETYDFSVPIPSHDTSLPGSPNPDFLSADGGAAPAQQASTSEEHVVVVRVYDRAENMAAAKYVVHIEK